MFFAGAALALLLSLLPNQQLGLVAALQASALLALGLALVVRCRGSLPPAGLHVVLLLGSAIVTLNAWVTRDPIVGVTFTFCYIVMIVVAIASFSWRGVAFHVAIALGAVTVLMGWRNIGSLTSALIVGCVTVLMAGVVGRILRATVDTEIDVMTRLVNRRGFEQRLAQALCTANADARSEGQSASAAPLLLVLDVDHFEQINRTGGQAAGDAALRGVADALVRTAPPGAVTARLCADQFALLLRDADPRAGLAVAVALQRAIAPVEASIGIARAEPEQEAGVLLRRAETSLYEAKAAGRNCVRTAESQDEMLLRNLRSAVANATIQVALQPLVDPTRQTICGVEALARWHHTSRGWVSPATFIPLAEKNGLIPELGQVVLERACAEARALVAHLGRPVRLTVNASGGELVRADYAAHVADVLHRTQWPAGDLVIEVTESSLDVASQATLGTIKELRQLGVKIAIDDFGTGYSAFSQLDAIPAEYLKLDTSFTAATTTSARRRAMLSALVALCHDLGLQVIAEGVETAEQAQLVADHGCDLAQGYFYARPMPVADLIASLQRSDRSASRDAPAVSGVTRAPAIPAAAE